jgi:ABC-2 type transport system ATP-binding protein
LGSAVADTNPKDLTATVVIQDINEDARQVLSKLAAAGTAITNLAVHKPTLDDVFLSLTGRQKRSSEEGQD